MLLMLLRLKPLTLYSSSLNTLQGRNRFHLLVRVCGAKRTNGLEKLLNSNLLVLIAGWLPFFPLDGSPSLLKPLAS